MRLFKSAAIELMFYFIIAYTARRSWGCYGWGTGENYNCWVFAPIFTTNKQTNNLAVLSVGKK